MRLFVTHPSETPFDDLLPGPKLELKTAPHMKKVLRSKKNQTFLTERGTWTDNPSEALQISTFFEAQDIINKLRLRDVELYYCFENDQHPSLKWNISLAIG